MGTREKPDFRSSILPCVERDVISALATSVRSLVISVFLFFFFSFFFCARATQLSTLLFLVASSTRPFPHAGLFAVTFDFVRRARRNIIVTFTQIAARYSRFNQDGTHCFSSAPVSWIRMNIKHISRHSRRHSLIFGVTRMLSSLLWAWPHERQCL